jgi:hypothetical protein
MQRLFRRKNQPPSGRGRAPIAWTAWEIALIVISLLLIVFPLYAEAYRWVNPSIVPAAQRETDTPIASPVPTQPMPPTDTPRPTNTPIGPTDTPRPTATAFTVTPGTITPTPPTDTPTLTPASATNTPTNTPIPTVAPTLTPQPTFVGTPPLSLVKVASVASAGIGQQFSYSISVFSNSATPRTVQVRDDVDSQLDIIGTPSASNGSCSVSGNRVSCTVTAQTNRPATITITVRVRADATLGSRATNQAAASDDQSNTDLSDQVVVEITNQVIPPTDTPGPTATTGPQPSATSPVQPSATPTTGGPINTPVNTPAPTSNATAGPTDRPRTPAPDKTQPPGTKPTDVPRPPLPPTPRPGQPLSPTPRRGQPTVRPIGGTAATSTPVVSGPPATATPAGTPTLPPAVPGLFFRMASDWGSAFPGQEVNYVIAASNTRTSGALSNVQISSSLPANLEILEAKADRGGDPLVTGNTVSLKLSALDPGAGVEIAIKTRIKATVAIGTQIVSQAELTFTGLALSAHSNIVTVLVVGVPPQVPPLQSTATLTTTSALATATPTPTTTPTEAATATATALPPTATGAPAIEATAGGAAASGGAPLPNTSAGVPFLGILMLGMTLMFRTVRVHREQTRI